MLTEAFAEAMLQAEKLIIGAAHVSTEQDLIEGYDYLAGGIKASLQQAWSYDRDHPFFTQSTGPYSKMGLDNPDTLYFHAYLRDDAEYVVSGRRGTTADLSFQVLAGDYTPVVVPDSLTAFDDRAFEIAPDGSYEIRFSPDGGEGANSFRLAPGSAMLVVREVFSDWNVERRGSIRIQRVDRVGTAPLPLTQEALARRYRVAGKLLLGRLHTFLVFPEKFYLTLPVNTMTAPRLTPGGLATQYSSVGHFDLDDDTAMVVTMPRGDAPYQGIQLGSMWYISLDYINHQTSLTTPQAHTDPDGKLRFVISERDPGVANWLERTGHRRGYVQVRWQRLSRELTPDDGPSVELVPVDELPQRLPFYRESRASAQDYTARIAERQRAVADRMLG